MSKKIRCLNIDKKLLNKLLINNFNFCQDILLKIPLELVYILSISLGEAIELIQLASKATSIQSITVHELMQRRHDKIISSGLPYFDEMFSLGLPIASLTEIAGPPGCGKTQLCLTIVASILTIENHKSIIYIDTEGAFDPFRLLEIARNKYPNIYMRKHCYKSSNSQSLKENSDNNCEGSNKKYNEFSSDEFNCEELFNLANRIIYLREISCDSLLKRLEDLEGMIINSNATLIIVDSIASIIRRQFDCTTINITHQRNKVLNRIVAHLKLLAETYDIPIIAVNQISTSINKKRKHSNTDDTDYLEGMINENDEDVSIALGPTWAHAVNSRVVLQFADGTFNRQMVLVKSPNAAQSQLSYIIGPTGIIITDKENSIISIDINNLKIQKRSGISF